MSLSDVHERSGISRQTVANIETSATPNPRLLTLVAIASALKLSLIELLDEPLPAEKVSDPAKASFHHLLSTRLEGGS